VKEYEPMNAQTAYDRIVQCGLVAGMRGDFPPPMALQVAEVLVDEGINVFEFTMNSAQAIESMQAVKREYGADAIVGMGTVLDVDMAQRVLDASADVIIAPSFSRAVVEKVQSVGVMMVPGVITATEAVDAWATGVKALKIFPIGPLGVDYFKAMRGPLNHIAFMCNGGTHDQNVGEFIRAGAVACGMAAWLTGDGSMPLEMIRQRAHSLRRVVDQARQASGVRI
jgi:2-dehydro-3-deoxyphosphogluconate aldolase / (4S)-4-hydroxy-2-oxoglutarate aldolase